MKRAKQHRHRFVVQRTPWRYVEKEVVVHYQGVPVTLTRCQQEIVAALVAEKVAWGNAFLRNFAMQ